METEPNLDGKINLDRDMIMLEILTEQILRELNDVLKCVDKYKQGLVYLDEFNRKKNLLSQQMLSQDCDEDQNTHNVRVTNGKLADISFLNQFEHTFFF